MRRPPSVCVVLFTLLIASGCCAQPARDANAIALRPGMPALRDVAVPLLHIKLPDGNTMKTGLSVSPREAYRWVFEPGSGAGPGAVKSGAANDKSATRRVEIDVATDDTCEADRIEMTVWDWHNRPIARRAWDRKATEPEAGANAQGIPGAGVDERVSLDVAGQGVYLLTFDGRQGDKTLFRLVRSFAVAPRNDPSAWVSYKASSTEKRDRFFVGLCSFPGRMHWTRDGQTVHPPDMTEQSARELDAELSARLGVQIARVDVSMSMYPPKDGGGEPRIDAARMDASVAAFTSRGLKLDLQLMNPPDWAIAPKYAGVKSNLWRYPHRDDVYERYVDELVTRYGKHAAFVQVFNEPDQPLFWSGEPSEFVHMFDLASRVVRRRLPDTPITNGGYAFIKPELTRYFAKQLKGKLDLVSYHSHGNLRELRRDFVEARLIHREAGYESPRFINTETGYAAWRLDQERAQAIAVLQKLLYCWAHGDEGVLLFCSRMTSGPARNDRDFGLYDYNFCPRFAYGAVASFMKTFASARFERVLVEKGGLHVYAFDTPSGKVVSVFTTGEPKRVSLTSDSRSSSVIGPMGHVLQKNDAGSVTLSASAYPKYVVFDGAGAVRVSD